MPLLNRTSLMLTIDYVNEAMLYGSPISLDDQAAITHWITSLQGTGKSYRGLYSPTNTDFENSIQLFTGEELNSVASAIHYLGQEAARIVCLFGKDTPVVLETYERAIQWMRSFETFTSHGTHCCGRCTIAYWRHFWVGDFDHKEEALRNGLKVLKNERDGKGKWKSFPYYYTLLALSDIDLAPARAELYYTLPVMERYLKADKPGLYYKRRKAIIEHALRKVS
jgi:hypothetical protein